MIKWTIKLGHVALMCVLFLSAIFNFLNGNGSKVLNNLPVDNEYRLKFVDSVDYELGLSNITKIIYPVDILSIEEVDGNIIIESYENSIVYTPLDCVVTSVDLNKITLSSGKVKCSLSNIICGVKSGAVLSCGDAVGTIRGNNLYIEVYWGTKKLNLNEIEALI